MITQVKLLLVLLLITVAVNTRAQTIDSFHINRSVNPHELFLRVHFPDSSYYVARIFDRVALTYPPFNLFTLYFRSCQFVKNNPVWDTMIPIYTPEPYSMRLWLAWERDIVIPGCTNVGQILVTDSISYDSRQTGITSPGAGNNALRISPNPAADVLYVTGNPGCELHISDGLGRLQLRQKLQNRQETLNISGLVPGLYYIHCFRDGQRLQSHCFSKLP
jgi:hypothetical protein